MIISADKLGVNIWSVNSCTKEKKITFGEIPGQSYLLIINRMAINHS